MIERSDVLRWLQWRIQICQRGGGADHGELALNRGLGQSTPPSFRFPPPPAAPSGVQGRAPGGGREAERFYNIKRAKS